MIAPNCRSMLRIRRRAAANQGFVRLLGLFLLAQLTLFIPGPAACIVAGGRISLAALGGTPVVPVASAAGETVRSIDEGQAEDRRGAPMAVLPGAASTPFIIIGPSRICPRKLSCAVSETSRARFRHTPRFR